MKSSSAYWLLTFAFCCPTLMADTGRTENNGAYAEWTDTTLTVGNAGFSRTYRVCGTALCTESLVCDGTELASKRNLKAAHGELKVKAVAAHPGTLGVDGVKVTVATDGKARTLWVFPGVSGVMLEDETRAPKEGWKPLPPPPDGRYYGLARKRAAMLIGDGDIVRLANPHVLVTEWVLRDMTDIRAEIVEKHEWLLFQREDALIRSVNVISVEDTFTGDGVVHVRLAPLPAMRPDPIPDFIVAANEWPKLNLPWIASVPNGYPVAELAYKGGRTGRLAVLQAFHRALRPYRAGRDGIFLSNTWGDSNRDSRINADFLMAEVEAGARLGVDVIQIDDGWQKGKSSNSAFITNRSQGAWANFRSADPNFWVPDPVRFPQGLKPIVQAAKDRGMGFGLWFGPDSSQDCASWSADADTLLNFYRELGIKYFKIDSLKMDSLLSLQNQLRMFAKMLGESNGEMTFDLDVTGAVKRPGYFGMLETGPLFVENRYCMHGGYWPHQTLRQLWALGEVIDPVRLRMEVLNPFRFREHYLESPLVPSKYRGDTLFAIVMVASPLGWFEISELDPRTVDEMRPLVARWKQERANLHGGLTIPVASKPDGIAWTGFATRAADGKGGYALLFRELNESATFTMDLAGVFPGTRPAQVEVIGGRGKASVKGSLLTVEVPAKLDFVWVKYF